MQLESAKNRWRILLFGFDSKTAAFLRDGIKELKTKDRKKIEIRSAKRHDTALKKIGSQHFDAILFYPDTVPVPKSLKILKKIHRSDPDTAIIILSDKNHPEWAQASADLNIRAHLPLNRVSKGPLLSTLSMTILRSRQEIQDRSVEKKYTRIIHEMPDAYFEMDPTGRFTYVNRSSTRHFNRPDEELIQTKAVSLTPDHLHEQAIEMYTKLYNGEIDSQVYNSELFLPDGSSFFVEIALSLLKGENGEPTGFYGISRDITEKKIAQDKVKESEEKYRTILENMEDAYFEMDFTGHFTFFNDSLCTMLGYRKNELMGMHVSQYITKETQKKTNKIFEEIIRTKEPRFLQYEVIRKDGAVRYYEATAAMILNKKGRGIGFRGVARDITTRRETIATLKKAKKEAERVSYAKSEFLANMSHEIRTPMNGVLGMYNLLMDTALDPEQTDYVKTGKRSAEGLLSIINDILDFSKIEAGKLDIEVIDFDLRKSIDEIVTLPAVQAHTKGLEFVYEIGNDVPALIKGDPGRLRQIIINLCTNAIKFTHEGEIFFQIKQLEETETESTLAFKVRDTGIGISKKNQKRLFNSFEQVDASTTRKYGGTGLGLAISKNLVELMGGSMKLQSRIGKGSEFSFTLPFEKQPDFENRVFENLETMQNKRILIVDDNQTNLNILNRYLSYWGCTSDMASSGSMALSLMHAVEKAGAPYDIVISDMLMPEMDGSQLGEMIKSDPKLKSTSLIMLTSQGLRGDASRMKSIGFDAYLNKPVRRSLLYDCLMTVLNQKKTDKTEKKETSRGLVTSYRITEEKRKQLRILLVEDNKINQKVALSLLKKFGLTTDAVDNGSLAVKALEQKNYHIVFMDIQMPEMDGITATRIIRDPKSSVKNHDVLIIAMTAHAMKKDREICLEAGMNDYITKPIKPDMLLSIIEKNINKLANESI